MPLLINQLYTLNFSLLPLYFPAPFPQKPIIHNKFRIGIIGKLRDKKISVEDFENIITIVSKIYHIHPIIGRLSNCAQDLIIGLLFEKLNL